MQHRLARTVLIGEHRFDERMQLVVGQADVELPHPVGPELGLDFSRDFCAVLRPVLCVQFLPVSPTSPKCSCVQVFNCPVLFPGFGLAVPESGCVHAACGISFRVCRGKLFTA